MNFALTYYFLRRSMDTIPVSYVTFICQTLPGLPRAARPSGRFAEGKTPQRIYFGLNMRKTFIYHAQFICSGQNSSPSPIPSDWLVLVSSMMRGFVGR